MIAKSYIKSTLISLDKLYLEASSSKNATYFSKLALIELCGWIEETMDDIVIKHCNRNLKEKKNKENYKKYIVEKNWGLDYRNNFRPMLVSLIGLIEIEKLEKKLEKKGYISIFSTSLGNLKKSRNNAAHTHIRGVTNTYDAPSVIYREYQTILKVLEQIDFILREK